MKKQTLIIASIIAAVFSGSIAQAGNFIGSNIGTRGIAIPGLNQGIAPVVDSCESNLEESQQRIELLEFQVRFLTPGTCEHRCYPSARPEADVFTLTCLSECLHNKNLENANSLLDEVEKSNADVLRNVRN